MNKKIISLVLSALLLSCSTGDNEENKTESIDPIIGTWKLTNIRIVLENGNETGEGYLDYCEKKDTYSFFADNTLEFTDFGAGYTDEECRDDPFSGENNPKGTWENTGNSTYIFHRSEKNGYPFQTINIAEFPNSSKMIFSYDLSPDDSAFVEDENGQLVRIIAQYDTYFKS